MSKHRQAKLYPSELVTVGIVFARKGGRFRAFYRWLKHDDDDLFAGLPLAHAPGAAFEDPSGLVPSLAG